VSFEGGNLLRGQEKISATRRKGGLSGKKKWLSFILRRREGKGRRLKRLRGSETVDQADGKRKDMATLYTSKRRKGRRGLGEETLINNEGKGVGKASISERGGGKRGGRPKKKCSTSLSRHREEKLAISLKKGRGANSASKRGAALFLNRYGKTR